MQNITSTLTGKGQESTCIFSPLATTPELLFPHRQAFIPSEQECHDLWDKYDMLDNIRAHCTLVARVATAVAGMAWGKGLQVNVPEVHASGLLHDLAKTYCVRHGGGHAQLGASWGVQETGNYAIAQGVFHHVYWPWSLPRENDPRICSLPFFVMYADKRARHDQFVTLEERFEDLLVRYGDTEEHRQGIRQSYAQGKAIERSMSLILGRDLSRENLG